jgi:O-antigen ligase
LTRGITTIENTGIALAAPGLRLIAPIGLILVGGLMVTSGRRLLLAFRGSVAGRGLAVVTGGWPLRLTGGGVTQPAASSRRDGTGLVWVAGLLAAAAGIAAGLTTGPGVMVPVILVVVVGVLALLLVRPEAMLLVVAAFPWLDWAARRALGGVGGAWDDALLLFAICLLLWCVLVLRRWRLWTVPITLPLVVALAAAIGSVVIREVPGDVGLYALRILFEPLLFYFLGYLFPKDKRWVRAAVFVFVLAGAAMALHGLYQYLTGAPMPASWVDVRETAIGTRAYSIVQNPNGLGAFLLMGALVSMSLALARGLRPRARLLWAGACAVHLLGIAVTFSRGAWIGLGAGVLVLLVVAYRRYLVPLAAAGVVGWFVAPKAFVQRLTFAFSSAYITKSTEAGRLYVWKMALSYIGEHPWFGLGLGTFGGTSAVTFGYSRLWVDSFYLQLGAEGGLLLLAFFLWILLRAAKGLVKGLGMTRDPYLRALTSGVLGAFVAVAVANFTASVWETLVVGVGFWFLTGLATSAALHEGERPGEAEA